MKTYLYGMAFFLLVFLGGYIAGRHHGNQIMERAIFEYQQRAADELEQETRKAAAKEELLRGELLRIQTQGAADLDELENRYRELLAELDAERLRNNQSDTADGNSMPNAAGAAGRAQPKCQCRSYGAVVPLKEALAIGRECDELGLRYNALLELYQTARQQ